MPQISVDSSENISFNSSENISLNSFENTNLDSFGNITQHSEVLTNRADLGKCQTNDAALGQGAQPRWGAARAGRGKRGGEAGQCSGSGGCWGRKS